jgi:hypothetical protein
MSGTNQQQLTEFERTEADASVENSTGQGETILFRLTSDQFVNEGIADIARSLITVDKPINVSPNAVIIDSEGDLGEVVEYIEDLILDSLSDTHRRKAVALAINRRLDAMAGSQAEDDNRWVPPASVPFPGGTAEDITVYDNDRISPEKLEEHGFSLDELDRDVDDESLYRLSQEYVGNNQERSFESGLDRFERYFEAFRQTLVDEPEPKAGDEVCMTCGSTTMPAYKYDGDDLEYNQSFAILASASGQAKPLGAGSRTTSHRGRCAACLIAGFYYSLMPKIVRPTATNENDTRVFTPVGNLEELVRVRADLHSLLDDLDEYESAEKMYPRQQTLGDLYTDSLGIQAMEVYEQIRRELFRKVSYDELEAEIKYRPTGLTTYVSEVGRTRNIRAVETFQPKRWAYNAVRMQDIGDGEEYWPVADVLSWFAMLDEDVAPGLIEAKNDIAFGILKQSLARVERGVFAVAKETEQSGKQLVQYPPNGAYMHDYFGYVMQQTQTDIGSIDDSSIESINNVASSVGQLFNDGDGLGVLIQFQNASTPEAFLDTYEKAAMQAQKKSIDDPPPRYLASRGDDVETVLRLIKDSETFEPTKRMFVIHASLAAQYKNARDTTDSGGDAEGGNGTGAGSE